MLCPVFKTVDGRAYRLRLCMTISPGGPKKHKLQLFRDGIKVAIVMRGPVIHYWLKSSATLLRGGFGSAVDLRDASLAWEANGARMTPLLVH